METFLSILLLIVIGIPWLLLTWKIYRLWCANTTTISFNGASGLFDAHFGYIIMSGLLAAAIIIVPIYLIVYVFTGLSELILHHYIITALLIILSIIIALGRQSKAMAIIAFILIAASCYSAYVAYDNYMTEKAIEQTRIEQKANQDNLIKVGQDLIVEHYATLESQGYSISSDTSNSSQPYRANAPMKNNDLQDYDIVVSDITPDVKNTNGSYNQVFFTYTLNYKQKVLKSYSKDNPVGKIKNITQQMTCYVTNKGGTNPEIRNINYKNQH